ncbi:MAG TPA: GNAT family N-acetyltransferase [Actinomycetota bacterium]|nr:GNAT family N-acetyltransferase [Actinomycetota bacterium]
MTQSLDVSVVTDASVFDLPEWRGLLRLDPNRHVFATPEWNRLWWEEFGAGKDLLALTVKRGSEVAGIVPLYRKNEDGRQILRFVGGIDLTDYLGPVCSRDDRREVADTLVDWLLDTDVEWDEFDGHNMLVPFGFAEFLVETADRHGLDIVLSQEETSALLPLASDWDQYLNGLESKDRHELRRKMRRFAREFPDARVRVATDQTLDRDLQTFVDMHRGAEGHKGHFMRPDISTFFERVARLFQERGWLRLDLLEIGDHAVASTFSFELDNTFYLYNSAYEPEAGRLSPGFVLVAQLVERSIQEGLHWFDFLRGPERYKYQLGAQALPLNNVRILKAKAQ